MTNWLSIVFFLGLGYLVIRSARSTNNPENLDPEKIVKRSDRLALDENFLVDTDE